MAKLRTVAMCRSASREWLKIKITRRQECVIAGYTDPRGSRENFGSIVLGLYDENGKLVHVGNAGSGFTELTHAAMWKKLHALETDKNPFGGKIESTRRPHWVKPELVAEIKFSEWTHEGERGGIKMRAPIYQGLRWIKSRASAFLNFPGILRPRFAKQKRKQQPDYHFPLTQSAFAAGIDRFYLGQHFCSGKRSAQRCFSADY